MGSIGAAGYDGICIRATKICAVKAFAYTTALMVGIDAIGYERRYCFERRSDAEAALEAWNGDGYPPGPWIKCKSATSELINPAWAKSCE